VYTDFLFSEPAIHIPVSGISLNGAGWRVLGESNEITLSSRYGEGVLIEFPTIMDRLYAESMLVVDRKPRIWRQSPAAKYFVGLGSLVATAAVLAVADKLFKKFWPKR
jgi:hypothetical protein